MKKREAMQKMRKKVVLGTWHTYSTVETIAVQVRTGQETRAAQVLREAGIPGVHEVTVPAVEVVVCTEDGCLAQKEAIKSYILVRCVLDAHTWHAIKNTLRERGLFIALLDAMPVSEEEQRRLSEPLVAVPEQTVRNLRASVPAYLIDLFRRVLAEKTRQVVLNAQKYFVLPFAIFENEWWEQRVPLPLRL